MRVTIMILLLFLLIKRNYCFRLAQIFGWRRSKYSIFSVYFLKTFTNFLHWDTQLSWQFHIFGWDTQFWYTKIGNFHDNFMFLVKWCHFYTTEMCKFSDFKTLTRHTVQRYVWVDNLMSPYTIGGAAAMTVLKKMKHRKYIYVAPIRCGSGADNFLTASWSG